MPLSSSFLDVLGQDHAPSHPPAAHPRPAISSQATSSMPQATHIRGPTHSTQRSQNDRQQQMASWPPSWSTTQQPRQAVSSNGGPLYPRHVSAFPSAQPFHSPGSSGIHATAGFATANSQQFSFGSPSVARRPLSNLAPAMADDSIAAASPNTSLLTQSRQPPIRSTSSSSSSSCPAITPAGVLIWTPTQEDLLVSCVRRHGIAWHSVERDYNASSSYARTIKALQNRWRDIAARPNPSPEVRAAMQAAAATPRPERTDLWSEAELEVLRRGIMGRKTFQDICADHVALFGPEKRSTKAIQARLWQMRNEEFQDDELEEGDVDGGDSLQEGEEVEEGVEMAASLVSTVKREPDLSPAGLRGPPAMVLEQQQPQYAPRPLASSSSRAPMRRHSDHSSSSHRGVSSAATPTRRSQKSQPRSANKTSNNPHLWSQQDTDLLLATVPRYYSGTIQWQRVTSRFNRSSDKKRSDSALAARWHALGYTNEDAQRLAEGRGGRVVKSEQPRLAGQTRRRDQVKRQGYEEEEEEAYDGGDFSMAAVNHQGPKQDGHAPFHHALTTRPQPLPDSNCPNLSIINVKITYLPEGVHLEGVFPGLEIMVFSPDCVQIFVTGQDPSASAQTGFLPAFHLRCVEVSGVQTVVVPPGTTMSATLVQAPPKRHAAGEKLGLTMQTSVRGPDGFLVLIS